MGQSNLYFMMGLPRSGKSTVCQRWLRGDIEIVEGAVSTEIGRPLTEIRPRVVVEDDAIRRAITGDRFNFASESQVYSVKYGMIRTLMEQGYDVLVDDTHTTSVSISRLLEIDLHANFCYVDTCPSVCIERAKNTKQEDPVPVIRRHYNNLQILAGVVRGRPAPPTPKFIGLIAHQIRYLRGVIIERMEHTKRV